MLDLSVVTALGSFQDLLIFRVSRYLPGFIIFLLTYRASLSSNQFSPRLDWVSSWKMVFPSQSIISQPKFHSCLRSLCFLDSCLLSLWQMPFLKPLEGTWGKKPSVSLGCYVSCVPNEPNVLRWCSSSATDTAVHSLQEWIRASYLRRFIAFHFLCISLSESLPSNN